MIEFKLVDNRLALLAAHVRPAAQRLVDTTAHNVVARAKVKMREPKHGRTYRRGQGVKRGGQVVAYRFHRASAPGEAPAIDTGHLTNSLQVRQAAPLTDEVTAGAGYAWYLEKRLNRQFLGPSMRDEEPAFRAGVNRLVHS